MSEGLIMEETAPIKIFGARHFQVILQCLFYVIIYAIQIPFPSSTVGAEIYVVGFLLTLLFGGSICKKYGFKWPMIISMIITSVITLNIPLISAYSENGALFCRFIQGLCAGGVFSMPAEFISKWIPANERTVLGTAVYASSRLGLGLGILISLYFDSSPVGWSTSFYQYGYVTLLWALVMAVFGANSPEEYFKDREDSELYYIIQNREVVAKNAKTPYSKILKSTAFWAVIVSQIGASWMLFVLTKKLPPFFRYNFGVETRDLLYITPLVAWLFSFVISGIAQYLINRGKTTIEQSRKIFNSIGTFVPALFLIYLYFEPTGDEYTGIALWTLMSVATIGTICGSTLNSNDISANFSPLILGTSAWFGQLSTVLSSEIFLGSMIYLRNSQVLIIFTAILLAVTNCFYLIFGSGEIQGWDLYEEDSIPFQQEAELSSSTSHATRDERRFLLFVKKQ